MGSEYVYPYTFLEAHRNNELDLYRESSNLNVACKNAIEQAIRQKFDGMILESDCAETVIENFGHDRVQHVLANTLLHKDYDGRFSDANLQWAKEFQIIADKNKSIDRRIGYVVDSHPAVLDGFINQARKAYQALGLFEAKHCEPDSKQLDYTGKVLVLDPKILIRKYKTPDDQLYLSCGGFGCSPDASGRKVMGSFLRDDVQTNFYRADFLGVIKEEFLPDWAREKLAATQKQSLPEQNTGPKMKL